MRVFVPFDARAPKTRLSPVLDDEERRAFAGAMCRDVLAAVEAAGHDRTLLATAPVDCEAPVLVDDRPLTPAVNAALDGADRPVAVVMADLPLAGPDAIDRLVDEPGDIVLAPGLGGGTNVMVVRSPAFAVDFHGASIRDHRRIAGEAGLTASLVDSFRLAMDVDEPADLAEVLLHGEGEAAAWLRESGFTLSTDDGRVTVRRTPENGSTRG